MSASAELDDGVVGDAELIASARSGDAAALGALYERHSGAAWVVARQYTDSPADADDVVADSFAAVFGALQRGSGPESAFRAYLFTVVRRVAGLRREKARRVQPTDDIAVLEAGTALAGTAEEPALAGFERGVVARAFHSLPERWQAVLWHTEVEGLSPAEIAPTLGLTANGVAALAYRAREGLRQAYLQEHLQHPLDEGCRSVAGKLGAYVRGGLGSRETAQVEAHLESCGTCRGLVLELGDVNHGMRSVIAPLVLGFAGIAALGVLLPVGGGIAAGAAATGAGAGAGGFGAGGGAGGLATAGGAAGATGLSAVTAGTAATGAVGVVGAGAAGGAAAAGGVAAFLAAIPLGAAAIAVGSVALAAAAAISIVTLLGSPDDATVAAPTSSASESSSATPDPSSTAGALVLPQPTDIPTMDPTPEPTTDPTADPTAVPTPEPTGLAADDGTVPPEGAVTADPVTTDPVVAGPTDPTGPTDPVPPTPAAVSVELPPGGLTLEAGLGDQELSFGLHNSGEATATDLVADVTLPQGVTLDGVAASAFAGATSGRFAVVGAGGWVCVTGDATGIARCTLDSLPGGATSTVVLRVSIDESYDREDGEVGFRVLGSGIDYVAPPIRVAIAAAPARLTLRARPGTVGLVSGRTRQLDLAVANVGGTALAAGAGGVAVYLPAGVTAAAAPGSATWTCTGAQPLTCRPGAVAARADVPLSLLLTAGSPEAVVSRSLSVQLSPSGRQTAENIAVPFTLQRPAALAITGPSGATVALGSPAQVPVRVTNTGDLPAVGVQVTLRRPGTVAFGSPVVSGDAWSCSDASSATVVCSAARLDPGAGLDVPVGLLAVPAAFGQLGTVTVSAQAPDADPAPDLSIAVSALSPVLALDKADPYILLGADGTGTARFTVSASVADAVEPTAVLTLPVNLRADPGSPAPDVPGCVSSPDRRTVVCKLATIPAGGSQQVLVNVRWAGSAKGPAIVVVAAPGVAAVRAVGTVQTSSAGLTARDSFENADVTEIGAPLLSCAAALPECAAALANGTRDNNSLTMVPLDDAPPAPKTPRAKVPVSSTARLTVPTGRPILFAGLYWSANAGPGDKWSGPLTQALVRAPGGSYDHVNGQVLAQPTDNAGRSYYQSFADVTSLVAASGAGDWSVADVAVSATAKDNDRTYYAGWSLLVVYGDPGSDASVTVYDGGQWIGTSAVPPAFEFASVAGTTARIGVVAWEGDRTGTGDRLLLGDTCQGGGSNARRALVPTRWDGTAGSDTNAFDSTATGWRANNSLGTDAKAFQQVTLACDVSSLTPTTAGDQYLIGAITLRTTPADDVGTPAVG